ncbi:TIGR01777 family oxidoreductase [Pseudonocardia sp. DSM 110487]|uniref:TIGR01777 family oxidoreductase n=1 Tax=Pseudonocardia sp. DSM 110487 TaxID=2865833 RepID=UPI001C69A533|nr:TIGR01777 family oxidoreductase [Pseudonocardia sp. DSM 110487]QYN37879.1 TIGR01777 family oxidoreductase [Pseudonocardia sp. DSM 110487]
MNVVIAGAGGLLGTALCRSLERDGCVVTRLVRRAPRAPGEVRWPPTQDDLVGADLVVNLAGAGLGDRRWTPSYKKVLLDSRIETTAALAELCAEARPAVLISASGMRWYGVDRGDEPLTEVSAPVSRGFLPLVAQRWEAATRPAQDAGVRVCHLRMGLVLSREGGVLPQLLPWFRSGLGATIGSGREFWSQVSLDDTIRAIRFLAADPQARGPYNITAPNPARSREFATALARELDRPAMLRLPIWPLRLVMGEVAPEVLGSLRVLPDRLTRSAFTFRHPDLDSALRAALQQ